MLSPNFEEVDTGLHRTSPVESCPIDHQEAVIVDGPNELKRGHPSTDEEIIRMVSKKSVKVQNAHEGKTLPETRPIISGSKLSEIKQLSRPRSLPGSKEPQLSVKAAGMEDKKFKYDAFSKAPFIVHFRLINWLMTNLNKCRC